MDLELTADQQAFRDEVRVFADREVRPAAASCEPEGRFPRQLLPQLARLGLMGIAVPRKYGGRGLDTLCACLAIRELARACPSTAVAVHVNNFVFCAPLLRFGSEAQKRQHLAPAAAGFRLGGFALSEPDAGADPSRIRVVARFEGRDYRLSGRKAWVTNGGLCASYLVVARVERWGREEGTALFIVDDGTPGMLVGKPEHTLGLRSALVTDISFDRCKVPGSRILGDGASGLKLALEMLQASRVGVAATKRWYCPGRHGEHDPRAAGRPLSVSPPRHRCRGRGGQPDDASCGLARRPGQRQSERCVDGQALLLRNSCSNVFGLSRSLSTGGSPGSTSIFKILEGCRVTTIYGGPSEIQRGLIARQLLLSSE